MNLVKCTLKNLSSKIWNKRHINIESNQWIHIETHLSGFNFKITLTGNDLSITNYEGHGFANNFQYIKN